jgi:hypothetical protein
MSSGAKVGIVFAVMLAVLAVEFASHNQSESRMRDEIADLHRQNDLLSRAATQGQHLDTAIGQPASSQPAADQELSEVLKLSGEVARLREDNKELEQLRQENRRLRVAAIRPIFAAGSTAANTNEPPTYSTRLFKLDVSAVYANLPRYLDLKPGESSSDAFRRLIQENGINLAPPATLYLNESQGSLFVRNTPANLEKIERLLAVLTAAR